MALKDTIQKMKALLAEMGIDIEKSERGNKAATQRVRTATIKFAKLTKIYRQESLVSEKKERSPKKRLDTPSEKSEVKPTPSSTPTKIPTLSSQIKKPTAKIPSRRI